MNREQLADLLHRVAAGSTTPEEGLTQLRFLPFEDLGFAHVDHHRSLRQGIPEVIYGAGKTVDQITAIAERILNQNNDLLATRVSPEAAEALLTLDSRAEYNAIARTVVVRHEPGKATEGNDSGRCRRHVGPACRRGSRGHRSRSGEYRADGV